MNFKSISLILLIGIIFISYSGFVFAEGLADWPEIGLEKDMREELTLNSYNCGGVGEATRINVNSGSVHYYKEVNGEPVLTRTETDGVCEGEQKRISSTKIDYKPGTNIQKGFIKEGKKCIGGGGYLETYDGIDSANQETNLVPEGAEAMWNDPRDRNVACGPTATSNGFTLAEIEEEEPEEPPKPVHLIQIDSEGRETIIDNLPRPYWAEPAGLAAIPVEDEYTYREEPITDEEYCEGVPPVAIEESIWKKTLKAPGKFFGKGVKKGMETVKGVANVFIPACKGSGRYENVLIQINPGDSKESILTRIKDKIIESLKPGCEIGREASRVNEAFITINLDNLIDNNKDKLVEACKTVTGKVTECQTANELILVINKCRNLCEEVFQAGLDVGGGAITIGYDCVGVDILNLIGVKADSATAVATFIGYGMSSSDSGRPPGGGDTGGGGGNKIISSFDWIYSGTPWSP